MRTCTPPLSHVPQTAPLSHAADALPLLSAHRLDCAHPMLSLKALGGQPFTLTYYEQAPRTAIHPTHTLNSSNADPGGAYQITPAFGCIPEIAPHTRPPSGFFEASLIFR